MTTAVNLRTLPGGRGFEKIMQAPPGGYADSILITRRMLPLHSDPGDPDVTFVAEFRADTIINSIGVRREHILKTGKFDYLLPGASGSKADSNRRYMAIDTLGVTLWHHGTTSPIAIRGVSLLTPQTYNATVGYWDTTWAGGLKKMVDSIQKVQDLVFDSTGRHLKVLGFYVADEFEIECLVGMRYRLDFLDRRLTSETGFAGARSYSDNFRTEFGPQKLHGFPTRMMWTSGLGIPSRAMSAPYFGKQPTREYKCDTCPGHPLPAMGYKLGFRRSGVTAPYRLHETRIITNVLGAGYVAVDIPLPSAPNDYTTTTAYEGMLGSDQGDVGKAAMIEETILEHMYQTGSWFFSKRREWWSNHFYHLDPEFKLDTAGRPFVTLVKFQPLTGEDVRFAHGTALNLGCRGFMYDKWRNESVLPPLTDSLSPTERAFLKGHTIFPSTDTAVTNRSGAKHGYHYPGYVTENDSAKAWDKKTTVTVDSLFRSLHIGGDYLTTDDLYRFQSWVPLDTLAKHLEVSRCIPGDSSENIYVGRKSVQMESKWWHDLVTDTVISFKLGVDSSNAHFFMKTRPIGWFAKGYKDLANGDTLRLRKWVEAFGDSLKIYRWKRKSATDTTLVLEKEPVGEQLYDVVLMDTSEAGVSDDNCIIAITNRRTSPHLFNNSLADSVEFMSSYDFDTLTRHSRPDLRYKQVGSRRITLPFKYTVDSTKPYLLRVRELRPSYDEAYTIDTIVNWNTDLTMFFRPGETRYFKINRHQATDTLNTGFLAYSTQNKMVAYPVANATNTAYTDSIRYHLTFHRRDDSTDHGGVWAVYYQRSVPYHRDSLPVVAGLQWETPIRLTGMTTSSIARTDALNRTLYFDIDVEMYLSYVNEHEDAAKNCCCGFPSIVVRETSAFNPKVFITYACEDEWADNDHKDGYFHIVENAFADVAIPNRATLDGNGKSLIICGKGGPHDRGTDTLKSLARWGTPVINAAASSNMYYAWSSDGGIGAATKLSTQDWLPANDAWTAIPIVSITQGTLTMDGGAPQLPSLNVYSNIAQNRNDATLVWQEGTVNPHIRYTRLTQGLTPTAIARALPTFAAMTYVSNGPGAVPVDLANNIAVVGGADVDDDAWLPVVVRSLQQDTMRMYERDSNGLSTFLAYNHETVAWQEYVRSNGRSRIRYNHFIDRTGFGPMALRYWYANTTYGDLKSLLHPVLTNGHVRLNSLVWEGWINDTTFMTYKDSLKIIWGNLSDSALIVNYNILPQLAYNDLKVHKDAGNAVYWTGFSQFSGLKTQQITVARMPGIPQPPSITIHPDTLRAGGAWPHLAMRQRENFPTGILSVRRVLQYTSGVTPAPSLVASAEQFYKLGKEEESVPPALSGGFEVGMERVTARVVLSDGRSVSFRPVYDVVMPAEYPGDADYAWQTTAMTTPVRELVTDVFPVGDVSEMKLLTAGLLRQDIEVAIEEVDPTTLSDSENGSKTTKDFRASKDAFTLTMAQTDEDKPEATSRAMYYLTAGDNKHYRLRMTYRGDAGIVFREDLNIEPEKESFEKVGTDIVRVVDLRSMTGSAIGASADLKIFPNPSSDRVTIIVDGLGLTPKDVQGISLTLDVADAVGRVMLTNIVSLGEAVDVTGLPNGVYVARVSLASASGIMVKASGQFSIVK